MHNQTEQATLELSTFKFLKNQEEIAIPRRIQVITSADICKALYLFLLPNIFLLQALTEDVNRQVDREHALQKKYGELQQALDDLKIDKDTDMTS